MKRGLTGIFFLIWIRFFSALSELQRFLLFIFRERKQQLIGQFTEFVLVTTVMHGRQYDEQDLQSADATECRFLSNVYAVGFRFSCLPAYYSALITQWGC